MADAGWYEDYNDPSLLRWYDGTAWTDNVVDNTNVAVAAAPQATTGDAEPVVLSDGEPVVLSDGDEEVTAAERRSSWGSIGILSIFVGFMLGAFLFNAVGALTPVTVHQGTVEDIEIEFSRSGSSTGSGNRRSYVLTGSTDDGERWRIVNEDAYRALEREGWPQRVEVALGNWTGTAERVTGATWEVDHQGTGTRIGLGAVLAVLTIAGLGAAWAIARHRKGGLGGAAIMLIGYFVIGNWLGYIGVQWIQSG